MDAAVLTRGTAVDAWRICAVIVTFHPDEAFRGRALLVARQADGVVIVDNGSSGPTVARLRQLAASAGIQLIANPDNRGIATALNQGVSHARAAGYSHALLLDQDTEPLPHMIRSLRQLAGRLPDVQRLAVLGANLTDTITGASAYRVRLGDGEATEVTTVMTAGSLLNLEIWSTVGPFRDDFFIDHVDEEYCLRARAAGYRILLSHEPLARHGLGAPRFRRLLWRTFGTLNHSAVRRYYMTRNHVMMVRLFAWREPLWVLGSLWSSMKAALLLLFIDDDRRSKLRLMARGLRDGLAGRMGKLPDDAAGTNG